MTERNMVDDLCIECGRPLDGDDDDLCTVCLRDQDEVIRQKLRPHLVDDRDGKRLAKAKRPKHKPIPEREANLPVPPKSPPPERQRPTGQRPASRPQQSGGRQGERR